MRKIEQEMCYAIRNKIAWSKGNTCTTFSDQGRPYCDTLVYLHGNLIAKINDTYVDAKLQRYNDMLGYQRFKTIVDNNPKYEASEIITTLYDADLTDIDAFKRRFTGIKRRVLEELSDYILEFNMLKKFTQSGGASSTEIDNSYQNVVGNVDWLNICCGFDKYDDIYEAIYVAIQFYI